MMKIKFKARKLKKNWKPGDELVYTGTEDQTFFYGTVRAKDTLVIGDKVKYQYKSNAYIVCSRPNEAEPFITIPITALICYAKTTRVRKLKVGDNVNIENKLEAEGTNPSPA